MQEMQSRKWSRVGLLDRNKFGPTAPTGQSNKKEPSQFCGSPSENTQLTSSTRRLPPRDDDTDNLDVAIRFGPDPHPWFHSHPSYQSPGARTGPHGWLPPKRIPQDRVEGPGKCRSDQGLRPAAYGLNKPP